MMSSIPIVSFISINLRDHYVVNYQQEVTEEDIHNVISICHYSCLCKLCK